MRRAVAAGGIGAPGQAEAQLQGLSKLQHRVAHANGHSLSAIRAEVVASVAATQAFAQQVRTAATASEAALTALHAASAAAHKTVSALAHAVFEEKKYDALLQFSSDEEREAYEKRAAERQRYIEEQLAAGTPQGNLNAARAMKEQMQDAGAHGADKHPDYATDLSTLAQHAEALESSIQAASPKTQELERRAMESAENTPAATSPELEAIAAQLRAAGVVTTPPATKGHGVTAQVADSGTVQQL